MTGLFGRNATSVSATLTGPAARTNWSSESRTIAIVLIAVALVVTYPNSEAWDGVGSKAHAKR